MGRVAKPPISALAAAGALVAVSAAAAPAPDAVPFDPNRARLSAQANEWVAATHVCMKGYATNALHSGERSRKVLLELEVQRCGASFAQFMLDHQVPAETVMRRLNEMAAIALDAAAAPGQ